MQLHMDPTLMLQQAQGTSPKLTQKPMDVQKLKDQCVEFEAILLQSMFKSMRQSGFESGLLDSGAGQDMYEDLFDMEISRQVARTQSVGIAEALFKYNMQNGEGL